MRRYLPVVASAIGILLLSACSGSSSDSEPTTTLASPVTTSPVTTSPVTTSPVTTSPAPPLTTSAASAAAVHIVVTSSAYGEGDRIPIMYTCEGEDVSPDYSLAGLPDDTVSIALTMDDPDAPGGTWDHWVMFDVPPVAEIPPGATDMGTMGSNSWDTLGYRGPCPPPGDAHRYVVTVYALDGLLALEQGATKAAVLTAMEGRILATGQLLAEFAR